MGRLSSVIQSGAQRRSQCSQRRKGHAIRPADLPFTGRICHAERTTTAILISAPGGLTTRRSSRPASMSAPMRLKCPRQERRCVSGKESAACRMARSPIRRSNWQDSSSWNFLPLTPPSNGLRDARGHQSAQLKSGRWRLKPCGEGLQDEWKQSGGHPPDRRARGPRIIRRLVAYLSREHARRSQRGGRPQQRTCCGAHGLAARRRAAKSGGLAADDGATLLYRSRAPSASSRGERTYSQASQRGFHGDDFVGGVSR